MKTVNKGIIAAAVLGVSALVASAAQASDGTVTINGEVVAQTCKVDVGGDLGDVVVNLPKVQQAALNSIGATAGRTSFVMSLTGCATGVAGAANVSAFFEHNPTLDTTTGNLINQTAGGSNVQVQLVDFPTSNALKLNLAQLAQGATPVAIAADGSATLKYGAQYVAALAVATPGLVNTNTTYSLEYN